MQLITMQLTKIAIVIESVYSMDGDIAPIQEILNIATMFHSVVIVDEAHGFGVFGTRHKCYNSTNNPT